jgi:hypothetical protein
MPEVNIQRFLDSARNDKPLAMTGGRAHHMVAVTAIPFTRPVVAVPAIFARVNVFSTALAIRRGRGDWTLPVRLGLAGRFGESPLPAVPSAISLLSAEDSGHYSDCARRRYDSGEGDATIT